MITLTSIQTDTYSRGLETDSTTVTLHCPVVGRCIVHVIHRAVSMAIIYGCLDLAKV